jgi:hypothetical protein
MWFPRLLPSAPPPPPPPPRGGGGCCYCCCCLFSSAEMGQDASLEAKGASFGGGSFGGSGNANGRRSDCAFGMDLVGDGGTGRWPSKFQSCCAIDGVRCMMMGCGHPFGHLAPLFSLLDWPCTLLLFYFFFLSTLLFLSRSRTASFWLYFCILILEISFCAAVWEVGCSGDGGSRWGWAMAFDLGPCCRAGSRRKRTGILFLEVLTPDLVSTVLNYCEVMRILFHQ